MIQLFFIPDCYPAILDGMCPIEVTHTALLNFGRGGVIALNFSGNLSWRLVPGFASNFSAFGHVEFSSSC
jgi:hypothetical protein